MSRWIHGRRLRRGVALPLACLLVALGAVALASGCGSSSGGGARTTTTTAARRVVAVRAAKLDRWTFARGRFREMCAGCHTLADAGTTGRRFNLDHSTGTDETHVRATLANGEPGMPAWRDVLSRREFEELVAYISTVAKRTEGPEYWHHQIMMRSEFPKWGPDDTRRLEAYAKRLGER